MDILNTDRNGFCAIRITMSPHEWTWTQDEQEEMARELLRLDALLEECKGAFQEIVKSDDSVPVSYEAALNHATHIARNLITRIERG